MESARKQMMAMGWTEGKGLGKNEDGIGSALKTRIKMDVCGLGYEQSNDVCCDVWFSQIDDIIMKAKSKTKSKEAKEKFYHKFIKEEASAETNEAPADGEEIVSKKRKKRKGMNIDEVYLESGGRTCHKGARHGVTMSAKLQRLQEQEAAYLKSVNKGS
ncbi:G patch domain-containing protein 4 [Halotydeus destructor]|nr:G patch domain-containing protein 4 [Halotydeus destructor]